MGVVVSVLAWFGIELTRNSGRIASIWLPNAVLLAAILRRPVDNWWLILLLGGVGNLLANLQSGDSLLLGLLLTACNIAEVTIAAACVLRFSNSLDFRRGKPMFVLILCCAVPAALSSSTLASFTLALGTGADFLSVFATWYPADTLGLIALTPLLLVLDRDDLADLAHPAVIKKLVVVVAVIAVAAGAIFLQKSMPLLFLAFPALLLATWLLGYIGGAIAVAAISIAAFVATLNHLGPISLMHQDIHSQILALQLFTATAALTSIASASVLFEVSTLRAALAQAPDFFYVKNRRSEFIAVNQRVAAIAQQESVGSMIGKTDFDVVAHDRADVLYADDQMVMNSGFPLQDKIEPIVDDAGVSNWYETTKVPLKSLTGRVIGMAGTTKNITRRKELEESAERARDELAVVLREMSDGIAVVNGQGYIVFCNQQYQLQFPLTGSMRVKGAYLPKIMQAAKDLGEQPYLDPAESMNRLKTGRDHEIYLSNGSVLQARSTPASKGGWVVVTSDITSIKNAEIELRAMTNRLEVLATTDGLTGLANRRTMDERLEMEVARARRTRAPIAIVMVDIDHFKNFNDTYGHQAGDNCLRSVAAALQTGLKRPGDFVARYGGEEFCIILPDTDEAGAFVLAEQLRLAVRELKIANTGSELGVVTISCGVSCLVEGSSARTLPELISRADQSLYVSKRLGRDRVTGWSFASSEALQDKLSAAAVHH
ncbi:MAG: diguanylate cyclase [Alphaproteobacteria bacterium]|nr:diguanylate cyclase [Alphaproteobacteria bacterium]